MCLCGAIVINTQPLDKKKVNKLTINMVSVDINILEINWILGVYKQIDLYSVQIIDYTNVCRQAY